MRYSISIRSPILGLLLALSVFAQVSQTRGQKSLSRAPDQVQSEQSVDTAGIERLIRRLGSARFADREAASKALDTIGEPALHALWKAQKDPDPEIRRRVAELVKLLTRRRAPARAKAWAAVGKLGGEVHSDTGTPDGRIRCVDFRCMEVCDADLAVLQWLDDATYVSLIAARITDAGLAHLKKLYRLQGVNLGNTKVTNAGLEHLKSLNSLTSLFLCGTRVTDAGLVHLRGLNNLRQLDLSHLPLTDVGLDHITMLNELEWLDLSHTQVTDTGLAKLKTLKKLNFLWLSDTQVTDAGLVHLKEIRTLETLNLTRTKVTSRGRADLQRSLPKLGFVR